MNQILTVNSRSRPVDIKFFQILIILFITKGKAFFLGREDFIKYLQHEAEEQENAKNAKAEEDEKSAFSGRKSRKERRILKEKRLAGRIPSPPSYATYEK